MSTIVPPDVMAFDVELALSKAVGRKCETFLCDTKTDTYKIRIGYKWNLVLDREQLEQLWSDKDNPSCLRDSFDSLKPDCLAFQSHV